MYYYFNGRKIIFKNTSNNKNQTVNISVRNNSGRFNTYIKW